jgi:hypothetical protein
MTTVDGSKSGGGFEKFAETLNGLERSSKRKA